ncbi:MAG TPA: acyl-CoA dehydrogenase family protein [Polyangiaceae bacterium]|nr:acyl-CoA dehydrogenase family protein [Polyangiaceae bacterium]
MSEHTEMTEEHSRQVAEEARERTWAGRSFLREIFLGNLRFEWISPFPKTELRPHAAAFLERLHGFLEADVDSEAIDRTGEYPRHVLEGLAKLGAFGMKIPPEFGGLGFNNVEYARALELCGRYDANIVAILSAHQSIGVPEPLLLFGTQAQKEKYLPRCARGAVSAFALTEPDVGSDPARLSTTATETPEGDFVIDGEKLWCTNGTIAELVVVMARDASDGRISAFLVETAWPGVEIGDRCHFMGLRAIENGVLRFRGVRVPKENLIGKKGDGLRIALTTLNTGRLGLPAACVGFTKRCAEIVREWSAKRVQWGKPIGRHEAVAHKVADITATTFAVESMTGLATELSLRERYDIRLEAAAAKEWATVRGWHIVDETMQVRGGRGYETESSLRRRGEDAIPVERMMRDTRINLIFEGSSEIMHLFMAREAVDKHLDLAAPILNPKATFGQKLRAFFAMLSFYVWWYPAKYIRRFTAPLSGELSGHLWFCERASRRLARAIFHGMLVYRQKLERRQAFLFRVVDVAMEIFAITASVARARSLRAAGAADAPSAIELADAFSRSARRRIERSFYELWHNDDVALFDFAQRVLDGRYRWIEATHGVTAPVGEPIEHRGAPPRTPRRSDTTLRDISG